MYMYIEKDQLASYNVSCLIRDLRLFMSVLKNNSTSKFFEFIPFVGC